MNANLEEEVDLETTEDVQEVEAMEEDSDVTRKIWNLT